MEFLIYEAHHLWDSYLYYLDRADPRVEKWPLMSNYWPTIALTMVYLVVVYAGVRFMRNRDAFSCYWGMLVYNVSLVILNFHIWFELITATTRIGYSYSCQPVDYSDNQDEIRVAKALWWYYISKLIEFLDTIFFVLRKKNNQITFLHVYHHATMFPIWWIGIKWVAGGQSFFGALINSFVHVVMYTYYCLSAALGPQAHPYLWWKKYLTRLQLLQFVLGLSHSAQSIWVQCPFPLWMEWALIIYGSTIMILFINFYLSAYVRPRRKGVAAGGVGRGIRGASDKKKSWTVGGEADDCGGGGGGDNVIISSTAITADDDIDEDDGDGVVLNGSCHGGSNGGSSGGGMVANGEMKRMKKRNYRGEGDGSRVTVNGYSMQPPPQQQQLNNRKVQSRLTKID